MRPWESPFPNPHLPLALKKKKRRSRVNQQECPFTPDIAQFWGSRKMFPFFLNFLHNENIYPFIIFIDKRVLRKAGSQIFTSPVFSLPNFAFSGQDSNSLHKVPEIQLYWFLEAQTLACAPGGSRESMSLWILYTKESRPLWGPCRVTHSEYISTGTLHGPGGSP